MENFRYADIHCHPTLKSFGHSFDIRKNLKSDIWHQLPPSFITKKIHWLTGVSKFSQANFTTLAKAKAKIVIVSLYPLEKGFFVTPHLTSQMSALIADWAIAIGYRRIRYLQQHKDYFNDLLNEYQFVLNSRQQKMIDGKIYRWQLTRNWQDVETIGMQENTIAVIVTIEGAHVFNSGLGDFGIPPDEKEILSNIAKVKEWQYAPFFIGLGHNFNNDICGHAKSLQRLGNLADQSNNLDKGLSELGIKVIHTLLDNSNGRSIFIDLKHMSLLARQEYMQLLQQDYSHRQIPLLVSHGAVKGQSIKGNHNNTGCVDIFNSNDINFYDEEIIAIAQSGGLFGLQMDIGIHADPIKLKKNLPLTTYKTSLKQSAFIIWNQLQYIAMVLDNADLFAWGTAAVGSDFDGSINPLPGILTAEDFEPLAKELLPLAEGFLTLQSPSLKPKNQLPAREIIEQFFYGNAIRFLKKYY